MSGWRLGTVPYLNAHPLTCALQDQAWLATRGAPAYLESHVPARLLPELVEGRLDAALVSTAGVLPLPGFAILAGFGVCSDGPVQSIQLYCTRPVQEIRSVALDTSSRSAVLLAQVLFRERWAIRPRIVRMEPELAAMLRDCDAGLLIGNPALQANEAVRRGRFPGTPPFRYDLGEEWSRMTGLPFVYAAWTLREDEESSGLPELLLQAATWGLARRDQLAKAGARELDIPLKVARTYLEESIRYSLGEREFRGLGRFCELAVGHGLLPEGSRIRVIEGGTSR